MAVTAEDSGESDQSAQRSAPQGADDSASKDVGDGERQDDGADVEIDVDPGS